MALRRAQKPSALGDEVTGAINLLVRLLPLVQMILMYHLYFQVYCLLCLAALYTTHNPCIASVLLQGLLVNVLVFEQTLFQLSYNLHHRVKHDDTGGHLVPVSLFLLTGLRVPSSACKRASSFCICSTAHSPSTKLPLDVKLP